ncbi:MAG: hypothetical protein Q8L85_08815 [Alphaproteobacteria bacterium]|nr:hypothetical protein [Alphaproteobacteria bacterium]
MLNIKKILFSFIFIFSTYQVFSIDEEDIQIVNGLKGLGLLNNETQITSSKVIRRSLNVKKIIFVEDTISSKIIKIEKKINNFNGDKEKLEEDLNLINKINKMAMDHNIEIPKIIANQTSFNLGDFFGFIQNAAKGKALGEYDIANMEDADIKTMFSSIGTQFGNLDHLMYQNNDILIHPDSHPYNFMYDDSENHLYWIDTVGIKNETDELKNYLASSGTIGSSLLETIYFGAFLMLGVDASNRVTNYPYSFTHHKSTFDISEAEQIEKLKERVLQNDNDFTSGSRALKDTLRETIRIRLLVNKKFALAVQSLGQAYVDTYPEIKSLYNKKIAESSLYRQTKNANLLRETTGESPEPIIDLLIP